MKVRPMIFNTEMINALLSGKKTVTRRPVKPQPTDSGNGYMWWPSNILQTMVNIDKMKGDLYWDGFASDMCPIASVGDLIYVRETMDINQYLDMYYLADDGLVDGDIPEDWYYREPEYVGRVPSIHMPRWASRLTLRITNISIERIQDITPQQALLEGIKHQSMNCPIAEFGQLWNSIYNDWYENPYVWVIEFEVIHQNIDTYLKNDAN